MLHFVLRDENGLPKKELHSSLWAGCSSDWLGTGADAGMLVMLVAVLPVLGVSCLAEG